jgi:integrase/recombinase XerD
MIERFFKDPKEIQRFRCNPLGPHLDSFVELLSELGYANSTVRLQVLVLAEFGQWLKDNKTGVVDLDEQVVECFFDECRRCGRFHNGYPAPIRRLLGHLRANEIIAFVQPTCDRSPAIQLLNQYEHFLRVERGLCEVTVVGYRPFIHRFLRHHFGEQPLHLHGLGPSDISDFILRYAHTMSPGRAKLMGTAFRSFFQFLFQQGEIDVNLAASVIPVADWRLSSVPKYLTPQEVERLLETCDQSTPTGRRNYAIILLLARLGLRAGEVVALELDDIDWRSGEIEIPGKGPSRDRLPLLPEVGEALVAYLRRDRPPVASRRVFICMRAPRRGLAHPSTVSTIVARLLKRAGLNPQLKGAHLLRHSLATGMLRRGASMVEIGEVLRHRSPSTTEIYAKVDILSLRSLAQPWPCAGGA